MTFFLILIIAFICTAVMSSLSQKQKSSDYIKSETSNCRLQYQIGCDKYNEFINEYKKHEELVFDITNVYSRDEVSFFFDIDSIKGDAENFGGTRRDYKSILTIIEITKLPMEKWFSTWILSNNYRNGDFFNQIIENKDKYFTIYEKQIGESDWSYWTESESGLSFYQREKQMFEALLVKKILPGLDAFIKYQALYLTSQSAIKKVAQHYGLPTNEEVAGTCHKFSTNTSSLDGLIYDYSSMEIKKLGYSLGSKVFGKFQANPTAEDYARVEECDTFTVRSRRECIKSNTIEARYPWLSNNDKKKKY